jgi:SH3 domain protein
MPLLVAAETVYVTDNLRLGLHEAFDTSGPSIQTLDSGQELEILSRDRNYAHVRLPDGVEGYVKAAYLVNDKPAKLIVAETQAESDRLRGELEDLRQQYASPASIIAALEDEAAGLKAQANENEARIAELNTTSSDLRQQQASFRGSLPISWVGGALGICLIGGFLFGLWWVDRRSRQRHGGIRIY